MGDLLELLLGALCFFSPLLLGLLVGRTVERRHFADLDAREDAVRTRMIVTQVKRPYGAVADKGPPQALTAEVVIATDYLKTFFANWRAFFGGEIRSYQSMLERARREAVMRIVEEADSLGYNAVGNIRMEPCEIGGKAAMAAIVATGTAYHSNLVIELGDEPQPTPSPGPPPVDPHNPYQTS